MLTLGSFASACGPDEVSAGSETAGDTSTGSGGETEQEPEPEPTCNFEWEWLLRVDGDDPWPDVSSIAVDDEGSVYAVGSVGQGLKNDDIWVAKWGSEGTQLWTWTHGSPGVHDRASQLQIGPEGELFVVGSVTQDESRAVWLASLDPDGGGELWSQIVGGTPGLRGDGKDLALTPDGQLLVIGWLWQAETSTPWLSKRSVVDGSELWAVTTGIDFAFEKELASYHGLIVTDDGEIWVSGTWEPTYWVGDFGPYGGGGIRFRYDAEGHLLQTDYNYHDIDGLGAYRLAGDGTAAYYHYYRSDFDDAFMLERRTGDGVLEWAVDESAWTIGEGRRDLGVVVVTSDDDTEIGGYIPESPLGGWPLWTARVNPKGEVSQGCIHVASDPDSGEPLRQQTRASASGRDGGLALYGTASPAPSDGEGAYWMWLYYLDTDEGWP